MASTFSCFHMCVFLARLLISITSATCVLNCHLHKALCIACALSLVAICVAVCRRLTPPPCYLIEFCCNKGKGDVAATFKSSANFLRSWRSLEESNRRFQQKVLLRSGVGDEESYVPPRLIAKAEDMNLQDAQLVNSSLSNPTPSQSAFTVNILNRKSNVTDFNVVGIGCSAGLLAIDFARNPLRLHRNTYAVVVSTENIIGSMYFGGNAKCMMVSNAHFRCGCAAILLSNKRQGIRSRAKLQLLRSHLGADQKAFECVQHLGDDQGKLGVSLQIDELLEVVVGPVRKGVLTMVYEPNFKVIDHFCVHPGGKAVIDATGKGRKSE